MEDTTIIPVCFQQEYSCIFVVTKTYTQLALIKHALVVNFSSKPQDSTLILVLVMCYHGFRVVGCLDRGTKAFNCVSVRPANPVEVRLASTSTALSELAMQSFITTFKED